MATLIGLAVIVTIALLAGLRMLIFVAVLYLLLKAMGVL